MMCRWLALFFVALPALVFAQTQHPDAFLGKSGCFLLYDLSQQRTLARINPAQCKRRLSPDSTFKVPLSLMAFNEHLITQSTHFPWDHSQHSFAAWNKDQTAQSWLRHSVVWVSQQITPQLGFPRIVQYLQRFHYGNQDFSGDPGKNNGLTQAWLHNSLQITAEEQMRFLQNMLTGQLDLEPQARNNTIDNMYLETAPNGARLYGKTGSCEFTDDYPPEGWFVGFVEKNKHRYLFVTNFLDYSHPRKPYYGGLVAKGITKQLLRHYHFY